MLICICEKKEGEYMPDHVLVEEMFNDLIEEAEYIKLKAHLTFNKNN